MVPASDVSRVTCVWLDAFWPLSKIESREASWLGIFDANVSVFLRFGRELMTPSEVRRSP
jgi:hypothetical protein